MNSFPGYEEEPLEKMLTALEHPVRAQVLAVLTARRATAAEIAEIIDEPAAKVRYHLRTLLKSGLVVWATAKDRRGAREYAWIAEAPKWVTAEQISEMSPDQVRLLTLYGLRLIFGDATRGLRDEAFARRQDHWLVWSRPLVDEQGWSELVGVFGQAFAAIEEVRERATRRLAESGDKPVPICASLLLFDREKPEPQ